MDDDVEEMSAPPSPLRRSARTTSPPTRLAFAIQVHEDSPDTMEDTTPMEDNVMTVLSPYPAERDIMEPLSYRAAMAGSHAQTWRAAVQEEYTTLMEQGTWELVPRPARRKVIGAKWVFKVKRDAEGNVARFKARLVVRGFSQTPGLDYGETYAPVGSYTTARILLAITAARDLELWQMDVKNAFVHGYVDRDIYMAQPEGFDDGSGRVCKLVKSLYGLKQSPRLWYEALDAVLLKEGYTKSEGDMALYMRDGEDGARLWLLVYVDDLLMASSSTALLQLTHDLLSAAFSINRIEPVEMYLGMNIRRDRPNRTLWLHQNRYTSSLMERYTLPSVGYTPKTPLVPGKTGEPSHARHSTRTLHEYQSILGSLLHAVSCTRPDLAYPCGLLAQYSRVRYDHHWDGLDRCLRYFFATAGASLVFQGGEQALALEVYADADDAGDVEDRKSRTGILIKFGGAAVMWKSKKQACTTLSSTESEYMAATHAALEVLWLRRLLPEFGVELSGPTPIYVDNKSAITLSNDTSLLPRTRHMGRRLTWMRDQVGAGHLRLEYIPTTDQVADFLTKPLPGPAFLKCRTESGLIV